MQDGRVKQQIWQCCYSHFFSVCGLLKVVLYSMEYCHNILINFPYTTTIWLNFFISPQCNISVCLCYGKEYFHQNIFLPSKKTNTTDDKSFATFTSSRAAYFSVKYSKYIATNKQSQRSIFFWKKIGRLSSRVTKSSLFIAPLRWVT